MTRKRFSQSEIQSIEDMANKSKKHFNFDSAENYREKPEKKHRKRCRKVNRVCTYTSSNNGKAQRESRYETLAKAHKEFVKSRLNIEIITEMDRKNRVIITNPELKIGMVIEVPFFDTVDIITIQSEQEIQRYKTLKVKIIK